MIPEQTVDTADVARFLLLSPHRVRQLAAQGVLEKAVDADGKPLRGRFNRLAVVNSYVRYLRGLLAGGSLNGADEYTVARAKRMSALADIEQLRLKRIHGELHHREDVEFCLTQMITACRGRLLALPSGCCHFMQGKTDLAEIRQILTDQIETALRELSGYTPAMFEAANEEYLASIGADWTERQRARRCVWLLGEVTRPGSGRKRRDTRMIQCSILRVAYEELVREEQETRFIAAESPPAF